MSRSMDVEKSDIDRQRQVDSALCTILCSEKCWSFGTTLNDQINFRTDGTGEASYTLVVP